MPLREKRLRLQKEEEGPEDHDKESMSDLANQLLELTQGCVLDADATDARIYNRMQPMIKGVRAYVILDLVMTAPRTGKTAPHRIWTNQREASCRFFGRRWLSYLKKSSTGCCACSKVMRSVGLAQGSGLQRTSMLDLPRRARRSGSLRGV